MKAHLATFSLENVRVYVPTRGYINYDKMQV